MKHTEERLLSGIDNLLDFADGVYELKAQRDEARAEAAHYKYLYELLHEAQEKSFKASGEGMVKILEAVLDPNSLINKGSRAIEVCEQLGVNP